MMKIRNVTFFSLVLSAAAFLPARGQQVAVKTNLLYDATTTINLGVEFGLGAKTSLDVSGNYNPWTFGDNRKWKHIMVQPELRFWTKERYRGFFWGPHAHYVFYNVGNLPKPFSQYMRDHRFEGWAVGAGVSAGYRWNFSPRIGLEAVIGAGYAYLSYDKFPCQTCGTKIGSETKHYFGPTKAAVSLVINLGKTKKVAPQAAVPVYVPPVTQTQTQTQTQTVPEPVQPVIEEPAVPEPVKTTGDRVAEKHPFIAPVSEQKSFDKDYFEEFIKGGREGSLTFYFRQGGRAIERGYRNNDASMDELLDAIRTIETSSDSRVVKVVIAGFASPEGSGEINSRLASQRAATLRELILDSSRIPAPAITVHNGGVDWQGLRRMVAESDMPLKARVLDIIDYTPVWDARRQVGRNGELMRLDAGRPYRHMLQNFFPELRNATYIKVYYENR